MRIAHEMGIFISQSFVFLFLEIDTIGFFEVCCQPSQKNFGALIKMFDGFLAVCNGF